MHNFSNYKFVLYNLKAEISINQGVVLFFYSINVFQKRVYNTKIKKIWSEGSIGKYYLGIQKTWYSGLKKNLL